MIARSTAAIANCVPNAFARCVASILSNPFVKLMSLDATNVAKRVTRPMHLTPANSRADQLLNKRLIAGDSRVKAGQGGFGGVNKSVCVSHVVYFFTPQ